MWIWTFNLFRKITISKVTYATKTLDDRIIRNFQQLVLQSNFSSDKNESRVESKSDDDETEAILKQDLLSDIVAKLHRYPGAGHNLFLIQPRVKFGDQKDDMKTAHLKLNEASALVQTLVNWRVIDTCIISVQNLKSSLLFGTGNLNDLKAKIRGNPFITGVFIGVNMLTALQNRTLEEHFGVQVFDRYQIVLRIFHDHARTKEAKLQIALAEIPYLKVKLAAFDHSRDLTNFGEISCVGGSGETYMETRRRLLFERELKIKKALEKLQKQREFLRTNVRRHSFPIIAVVGYTNCGKTSLIRSLTSDLNLIPENKLFATLDVTLHAGMLPSSQKVLFVDTVGFISDVPTTLIQSFKSTLEDALFADLIVHVRDISHPSTEMQKQVVLQTLQELNLPEKLLNTIIEVGNKVDLLENEQSIQNQDLLLISATEGTNLSELLEKIEEVTLRNTGRSVQLFHVTNGGEDYRWLMKNAAIRDCRANQEDPNYLIVEAVITTDSLSKFKHEFGDLTITVEEALKRITSCK